MFHFDYLMTIGKLVRLSPETLKLLEKARIGFETPNDCINRLLCKQEKQQDLKDVNTETKKAHHDKYGNYWTWNDEDKIWTLHLDPKDIRSD